MKMMEGSKADKYVLLDDDSDMEEYDKSKESLMKSMDGKTYIRRSRSKPAILQPQWLCQTLFIVLLVAAQGVLTFYFLRMFWDLEAVKQKHVYIFRNGEPQSFTFIETSNISSEERLEYGLKNSSFSVDGDVASRVYHAGNDSLSQRLKQLEIKVKFLELIASAEHMEEKKLQSLRANEKMKISEDAKSKAIERQMRNLTDALDTLQKRLQEGLDNTLLQISQLKDDFYFIENALNLSSREPLSAFISSTKKAPDSTRLPSAQATAEDTTSQASTTAAGTAQPLSHKIKIPFIKNLADFQVFFYGADKDASGQLTYAELLKVLADDAPKEEELQKFDQDNNQMYSYLELMKTFELD